MRVSTFFAGLGTVLSALSVMCTPLLYALLLEFGPWWLTKLTYITENNVGKNNVAFFLSLLAAISFVILTFLLAILTTVLLERDYEIERK